jgi:hypothetical protein
MQSVPFRIKFKSKHALLLKNKITRRSPSVTTILVTFQSLSPWLLGCCCGHLRRSEHGIFRNRTYIHSDTVLVLVLFIYPSIHPLSIYLSMALQPFSGLLPLFQFLELFTQSVALNGRCTSPSQGRYLHTGQRKHRINTQTSMPRVGFEPTIPVFERAKTVHAIDRRATAIGLIQYYAPKLFAGVRATFSNKTGILISPVRLLMHPV